MQSIQLWRWAWRRCCTNFSSGGGGSAPLSEADQLRRIAEGYAPATGERLADLAHEVFGTIDGKSLVGGRSGRKFLQAPYTGPRIASWYPERIEANPYCRYGMTEKQERFRRKLAIWRMQGRGPPKKHSGKRAKRR
ncbi:hypothetical protein CDCA_CDCA03G0972 [Cyanidium caldarium]|uniref:Uncharacterized protein n=1 Tax=Cyanidium caldarium TaxID=2771 RepID=A0AAV9IRL9_CYACA|nr:hypothetical protein CDCA_CDCA03G0972 [Cyanidium caldarium]